MKELLVRAGKYLLYIISLGWGAHVYFVSSIKAEIAEKVESLEAIRESDMKYITKRLDRLDTKNDLILQTLLNKEVKK